LPDYRLIGGLVFYRRVRGKETRMGSVIEELRRREAAARAEADGLRSRIEELAEGRVQLFWSEVTVSRVNDKRTDRRTGERMRFSWAVLPSWARKTPQVTEVLPLLYLHGVSSGDFVPALGQEKEAPA
jgi:hypothetical protein